jgi:hypothetical protein
MRQVLVRQDQGEARLADPKVLRDLAKRLVPQPGQLDRALTELRRVWCGHPNSSLGAQCRLSSGVRETGGSSHFIKTHRRHEADVDEDGRAICLVRDGW